MPTYSYRIVEPNKPLEDCKIVDIFHGHEEVMTLDPLTGFPLEKVYTTPNIGAKYTNSRNKKLLSPENIKKAGFERYRRDKITGEYYKD